MSVLNWVFVMTYVVLLSWVCFFGFVAVAIRFTQNETTKAMNKTVNNAFEIGKRKVVEVIGQLAESRGNGVPSNDEESSV